MDAKSSYKASLKAKIAETKQAYKIALFSYERTSISDPLWDEVRKNRDNAYINFMTAKSRLNQLDRASSTEEARFLIQK